MPKQPTKAEVNTFVKGLVTEASPLNFPPNCSLDEENFELNSDGTRNRRKGMDREPDGSVKEVHGSYVHGLSSVPHSFRWNDAGGEEGLVLCVVQNGYALDFWDINSQVVSVEGFRGRVSLSLFDNTKKFSFAIVDGRLIVVSGKGEVAVVEYSSTTKDFTFEYGRLLTRDLWGVEVVEDASYEVGKQHRSGTLHKTHKYNLRNQSWGISRKDSSGALADPITTYHSVTPFVYPSNSETIWPALQYQPVTNGTPFQRIYPALFSESLGIETSAPRGAFLIDVIDRGASRMAQQNLLKVSDPTLNDVVVPGDLPVDYTAGGCTVVAEFSGRVFYGGFSGVTVGGDGRSPSLNNYVMFSQLVRSKAEVFRCYQDGDPTSRDEGDIVETDGGFIRIAGVDRILSMVAVSNKLVIIASNGVWAITGGSDYGFTASNYRVDKVSNFGCLAPASIVVVKGMILFWSEEGITKVEAGQLGDLETERITDSSIRKFYQGIPAKGRQDAVGVYDSLNNKVRWLYTDDETSTCELVVDLTLGAFYRHRIRYPEGSQDRVVGYASTSIFNAFSRDEEVWSGTDIVYSDSDYVICPGSVGDSSLVTVKYLFTVQASEFRAYTFGYYRDNLFRDFVYVDGEGVDAKAFLLTGAVTAGDSSAQKQIQYLTMHFKRTEKQSNIDFSLTNLSSCLYRMQWDWSGSAKSMKWSATRQAYRDVNSYVPPPYADDYDTGFYVVTTKNLVRGRGKAFSMYVETEPERDLHLLGWAISIDGNSNV